MSSATSSSGHKATPLFGPSPSPPAVNNETSWPQLPPTPKPNPATPLRHTADANSIKDMSWTALWPRTKAALMHRAQGARGLVDYLETAGTCARHPIAILWGIVGIAAIIEDPSCLWWLEVVGPASVGFLCAGILIVGVLAIEDGVSAVGDGLDDAWGRTWRWVKDVTGLGQGAGEQEVSFVQETAEQRAAQTDSSTSPSAPVLHSIAPLSSPTRPALQTPLATSPRPAHHSGLLGPSPMPPRQFDFKHFTGEGFYRHEQKLKAIGRWSVPGGKGRTFDDILREVEDEDDEKYEGVWEDEESEGDEEGYVGDEESVEESKG